MNNEQPTVEQSITQLVSALQESKGWMRDYADAVIRDAVDRKPAEGMPSAWIVGYPQNPWASEWFIAETTFGDRVVLRELPEEYTYDFKTADDTYIKKDRVKRWMQFPDSQFTAQHPCPSCTSRANGSTVLVPSAELEKLQDRCADFTDMNDEQVTLNISMNREINELQAKVAELEDDKVKDAAFYANVEFTHRETLRGMQRELTRAEAVIEKCKSIAEEVISARYMTLQPLRVYTADEKCRAEKYSAVNTASRFQAAIKEYQEGRNHEQHSRDS